MDLRPRDLGSTAGLAATDADIKGVTLRLAVDDAVAQSLVGNDFRTNQIVLNLMSNAVKLIASGTVALSIGVVGRLNDDITLEISVSDMDIEILR